MTLHQRIAILEKLRDYLKENTETWQQVKKEAFLQNNWFVESFVDLAVANICGQFLSPGRLLSWAATYQVPETERSAKTVGLVMAGNLPLVGFHDFLCAFIAGWRVLIKPSSKDTVLLKHVLEKMVAWDREVSDMVELAERLNGCNAYIATGSNNSGRYFEYYFRNYPSIIRKNRTSVAIVTGQESAADLDKLADDMMLYFGLGCRNVSKIYVPKNYDFIPLLASLNKYKWMEDHNKFRNNYDYNLSLHILNNRYYMTNGTVLLVESDAIFSPLAQVHLAYYEGMPPMELAREYPDAIQCVVGMGNVPFGQSQIPGLTDYADGVDTMQWLMANG